MLHWSPCRLRCSSLPTYPFRLFLPSGASSHRLELGLLHWSSRRSRCSNLPRYSLWLPLPPMASPHRLELGLLHWSPRRSHCSSLPRYPLWLPLPPMASPHCLELGLLHWTSCHLPRADCLALPLSPKSHRPVLQHPAGQLVLLVCSSPALRLLQGPRLDHHPALQFINTLGSKTKQKTSKNPLFFFLFQRHGLLVFPRSGIPGP